MKIRTALRFSKSTLDSKCSRSFSRHNSGKMNESETSVVVFIDLTKAFETFNCEFLLNKLYHYGVRSLPLELFLGKQTTRKIWRKVVRIFTSIMRNFARSYVKVSAFHIIYK